MTSAVQHAPTSSINIPTIINSKTNFSKTLNTTNAPDLPRIQPASLADNRLSAVSPSKAINAIQPLSSTTNINITHNESNFNTTDVLKTLMGGAALAARIVLPLVL